MKYYMLAFDERHAVVDTSLHRLLGEQQEVKPDEWDQAGGRSLSGETPSGPLWGARPGLLLLGAALRNRWVTEFGERGLLATTIGDTPMFLIVPRAVSDGVTPEGDWREHRYFGINLGPPHNQRFALALCFGLRDPVVRQWDGERALAPLYSEDVVEWLRESGARGVSFTLVWDPSRTVLPAVTEFHQHERITL